MPSHRSSAMSMEPASEPLSEVQQFFAGAHVLVTGATGFMGKVLVEKLLRSCPDVDAVYFLLRTKRGKGVRERLAELTRSPCFDRLRAERGAGFASRLHAVSGDIGAPGLGLNADDRRLLGQRVAVVFHAAATVKFDEHISVAIRQNVRATRDVLALCRTCVRLKAVVHVSTAYSNCTRPDIEEKFYEMSFDCDKAIKMAEDLSEDEMTAMTKTLLGAWPNSYTFTKALAEQVVEKHGRGLPVAIARPAIVVGSSREPVDGWTDSLQGLAGVVVATAAGVFRTSSHDFTAPAMIVPCDLAVNCVLVAAWALVEKRSNSALVPIYNFVPVPRNRITWDECYVLYRRANRTSPITHSFWYPFYFTTPGGVIGRLARLLFHLLPALAFDLVLRARGETPRIRKGLELIHKYTDITMELANAPIHFDVKNVPDLWAVTSPRDRMLFPFDMRTLDWPAYIQRTYLGIRKLLVKEEEDTIPAARVKMQRLFIIHYFTVGVVIFLLGWMLFSISSHVTSLL